MSLLPPPSTAPAGWYPDPAGAGMRYYDGYQWAAAMPAFATREPHPVLPMRVAVGALVLLAVSLVVGKLLIAVLEPLGWPVLAYIVLLVLVAYGPSVGWSWYVRRRWGGGQFGQLGWRFRWSDIGWGLLTLFAAYAVQTVLALVIFALDIPFQSNVDDAADFDIGRAYVVATLIATVVAAPVVEELVFRGVVMRGFLSRLGPVVTIGLQAVLFGLAHADPVRGAGNIGLVIALSGVGAVFGGAAFLLRRLGVTVMAHAYFNGITMLLLLTGWLEDLQRDLGSLIGAG